MSLLVKIGWIENKLLFFPSHENSAELAENSAFTKWTTAGKYIGWKKVVNREHRSWLFIHGNAGQAIHRTYAEHCFSKDENIFILEYPGYGEREGSPSADSFNAAAMEAYTLLKEEVSEQKICLIGESIGSGPTCFLASQGIQPEKIVLVVPFDNLKSLAQEKMPFLPVSWMMRNQWDNIDFIKSFEGPIEIYGAEHDEIIPLHHAEKLARSNKNCRLFIMPCGHNSWSYNVTFFK